MTSAGRHQLADQRFAIFITDDAVYWRGGRPEPEPFWLSHSSRREARCWVQCDQQSPDTLWYSYPPFYLAKSYTFKWEDLGTARLAASENPAPTRIEIVLNIHRPDHFVRLGESRMRTSGDLGLFALGCFDALVRGLESGDHRFEIVKLHFKLDVEGDDVSRFQGNVCDQGLNPRTYPGRDHSDNAHPMEERA